MLARTNAFLGDYASARREQARAVIIHERVGGPNHPFVAIALTDLANVYREEGLPVQALPLLERALAIREKNLGPNHRDVAWTLADMASTLVQTGQMTRAQAAATRAVGIWERLDTPDAPDYATALALYAELQARRGDDANGAEILLESDGDSCEGIRHIESVYTPMPRRASRWRSRISETAGPRSARRSAPKQPGGSICE